MTLKEIVAQLLECDNTVIKNITGDVKKFLNHHPEIQVVYCKEMKLHVLYCLDLKLTSEEKKEIFESKKGNTIRTSRTQANHPCFLLYYEDELIFEGTAMDAGRIIGIDGDLIRKKCLRSKSHSAIIKSKVDPSKTYKIVRKNA